MCVKLQQICPGMHLTRSLAINSSASLKFNSFMLITVVRKYEEGLYTNATEVAADVRLMFENCYHYWGPCDVLSKRALKLEQLFEQKLAQTSV